MTFAPIDTGPKRSRLTPRKNPYWRPTGHARGGLYLGYRKLSAGPGAWIAKIVKNGRRVEERIGIADDRNAPADALSFSQAVRKALEWASTRARQFEAAVAGHTDGVRLTVRDAVESYVASREARNPSGRDARLRLERHVLTDEKLVNIRMSKLTGTTLVAWRKRLSPTLQPATVNRLMNDLRAAFNVAIDEHRAMLHHVREEVKFGTRSLRGAVVARERQVLTPADVRTVTAAAFDADDTGDLGRLVLVLAATGARFSQISRLLVRDVQVAEQRIMIPVSAKGRGAKSGTHVAVPIDAEVIARLHPALAGRGGNEPLLERWRHRQTGPVSWVRERRGPWTSAAELTRPWKQIIAATGLPSETVAYALRHSSIVRMLRANVSTRFVALAHDTSVAMIEQHYAAHILDDVAEIVRRAIEPVVSEAPRRLHAVMSDTMT